MKISSSDEDLTNKSLYIDKDKVLDEFKRRQSLDIDEEKLLSIIKPTPSIQKLLDKPHLVYFRQVATPSFETIRVIKEAEELGLDLCIIEYYDDKFVGSHNQYKHSLGKMPIYQFTDSKLNDIFRYRTIVDFNTYSGYSFSKIKTLKEESLIELHHNLFKEVTKINLDVITINASDWFLQFKDGACEYYKYFFALFLKHNVLIESFQNNKDEYKFTRDIVAPSFYSLYFDFGLKPLVLECIPRIYHNDLYWDAYPNQVDEILKNKGYY